jgi:hypothetical protein
VNSSPRAKTPSNTTQQQQQQQQSNPTSRRGSGSGLANDLKELSLHSAEEMNLN